NDITSDEKKKSFLDNYGDGEMYSAVLQIIPEELSPDPRRSDCHICRNATWFTSYGGSQSNQPDNLSLYCQHMNVVLLSTDNKSSNILIGECDGCRITEDEEE
ncbi:TPA: hypothetical protein ACILHV_004979, partial [Escherichia coli]